MTQTSTAPKIEVGPRDAQLFRALQTPLPLVERPFEELARAVGAREAELIEFANRHLGGAIRRYVGTLRHRKLGVKENGMVVWRVAEDEIQAALSGADGDEAEWPGEVQPAVSWWRLEMVGANARFTWRVQAVDGTFHDAWAATWSSRNGWTADRPLSLMSHLQSVGTLHSIRGLSLETRVPSPNPVVPWSPVRV